MAGSKQSSVIVDLTMDDADSFSKLSDAGAPTSSSKAKVKAKAKPCTMKKSASSSDWASKSSTKSKASAAAAAAANGTTKAKARKSEPILNKSTDTNATADEPSSKSKAKRKEADGGEPKASPSRSAPISDLVRARTHVNCQGNPTKICHQHHHPCKGPLLECTFMRAPGKRCQGRYCFSSLKRFYAQDPEATVKSNRMMINAEEHCPPTETKYAWKCPRCRGRCDCSTCRKAKGLEPLGKWTGPKEAAGASAPRADTADGDTPNTKKVNAKANAKAKEDGAEQETAAKSKSKGKGKATANIAEVMTAAGKQSGKGKGEASKANIEIDAEDEDDGISTPPPPGASSSKPAATKKTLASILASSVRAPIFKPLKAPSAAPPPAFEVIATKLPEDNMRARMWIYESMVRFDKFGLNRGVLSQLDKFDNWTHAMVQEMLACLLRTIAGLRNIEKGQATKPCAKAVAAYRIHGKCLQRGEPWSAASELLTVLRLERTRLPYVEHEIPVEVEAAAAQRSPSPPLLRVRRGRRAKENKQYEIARQLSTLVQWEEDEFAEAQSDGGGDDEEEEDAPSSRRRRGATKKSIYVYDDHSDDDSMADPDDGARGDRRSGRARKPVKKEPAPQVRLTGRQQAIKLQKEQQKEEEAKQRQHEDEEEEEKEAEEKEAEQVQDLSRKRRSSANGVNGNGSAASDLSGEDEEEKGHTKGQSQKKRRRLTAGSCDDQDEANDSEHEDEENGDAQSKGGAEEPEESDQREEEPPDLETKVSILSSLIDAAVMADSVAEELKTAADNIVALERTHRAANADLEKEMAQEVAEINKCARSMVAEEYYKWRADKAELEAKIAWRRLNARVTSELATDTHALRTGPMGYDVDGREYWHLREYQERMPKFTQGRYAWCLVVLGKAFPVDPNQPKEEEEKKEEVGEGDADVSIGEAKKGQEEAGGDDSGLTSLDGASEAGKAQPDTESSTCLELAQSATAWAESDKRICMGANDTATIKKLIDYVTYRLEQVEYEEKVSMQEREKAVCLAKEGGDGGGSKAGSASGADECTAANQVESMYSIRKAKQTLKDRQEERRKQVEQLVKRLNKSNEYFAWHRDEVPP
ncbi:uncharacterized protein UDID_03053 [Ustilago sp. UG-2017a]|nr:uncharacterized protein UDID_03053 [Ustilago sp. UG-2017a]